MKYISCTEMTEMEFDTLEEAELHVGELNSGDEVAWIEIEHADGSREVWGE